MTCIVGMTDGETVFMGGDTNVGNEWSNREIHSKRTKVYKIKEEFLIGVSGYPRHSQLVRYKLADILEEQSVDMSNMEYMTTVFIDAMREVFRDSGALKEKDNLESSESSFLIGYKGELYKVESNFQIILLEDRYNAIGSGFMYALGAIDILIKEGGYSPEEIIEKALKSSAKFNPYVGEPFTIKSLTYDEQEERIENLKKELAELTDEERQDLREYWFRGI